VGSQRVQSTPTALEVSVVPVNPNSKRRNTMGQRQDRIVAIDVELQSQVGEVGLDRRGVAPGAAAGGLSVGGGRLPEIRERGLAGGRAGPASAR
jgi:hypothetical protein